MRILGLVLLAAGCASASTIFFAGDLRTDATITACGPFCALASSDTDATWAQWAAVAQAFTVSTPSLMNAITFGYAGGTDGNGIVVAPGGLEPYLSLFDSGGNFLASTFFGVTCPTGAGNVGGNCFDVELDPGLLSPGTYTIVLSAYMNTSLAENNSTGTLADGFTGLGNLGTGESLAYAFDLNLTSTVPEPGTAFGVLAGVLLFGVKLRFHGGARRRSAHGGSRPMYPL
jgi:hypothetical protein